MAQTRYDKKFNWPNSTDKVTVNCDLMGDDRMSISSNENKTSYSRSMTLKITGNSGIVRNITISQDAAEFLILDYGSLDLGKLQYIETESEDVENPDSEEEEEES